MKSSMTALILAMFSLGSVGVFAQEPGQSDPTQSSPTMDIQGKEFSELDSDGDGKLTQSEAQQSGMEPVAFESLDQNGDQEVSEQEFEQAKESGGAR
ncbi:EF-hand domain-containing protein [Gilvimarinus sp. F26214L]|uniref:EF-hand domain-containing protein n=1 Tax=Gilvimarinus sp. DZF01 TaxID=3461371 RepID=UPI004045C340